ncbi:hypothetical protein AWJ20_1190 [Sugiyamaella lignohabitans]|uniref:Indigoidine synthase A family protein n=1 Tax=Sugiyamaella lignohabitans TaxID=796027 RepID=A0A167DH36_9ASCO|nr:uncharacterized protein AWJ20_1190 [Sugiyamaella lignohabitans]ANB12912.1 hypothetical protein AWJ20_1190 [Sugiyamaella lignohabitans]
MISRSTTLKLPRGYSGSVVRRILAGNGCRKFGSVPLQVSPEVQQALADKKPIVALESTIITHGLPFPENLQMAADVESIIRSEGAVPATTAFINGVPLVGTTPADLEYLAGKSSKSKMEKISRRDIPYIMSRKLSGGTTIAGTMILAHRANIKVFSTGGLGGVHRGVESSWDISADLDELGRTPVGVVCSGPKSILDIPRTMEYLETKGVHVSTLGPVGTNIPGFYTRDSGVPVSVGWDAASGGWGSAPDPVAPLAPLESGVGGSLKYGFLL